MRTVGAAFLVAALLGGCAAKPTSSQVTQQTKSESLSQSVRSDSPKKSEPSDPFEPINRAVWYVNWHILDRFLIRPATIAYTTVMPQFARTGLLNATRNLEEPSNIVNNVLQGKGQQGLDSASRFLINSTFGIFGLIDIANEMGIARQDEDFDEALGVWGVGNGPYLMVPALGPYDVRGFVGDTVDSIYFPFTVIDGGANVARIVVGALEGRASLIAQEQQLRQSPDDYAFVKSAYFQNKAFQVSDGKVSEPQIDDEQLNDFDDFEALLKKTQDSN
jgi:phospholipid-binding lipoprotein MlaA